MAIIATDIQFILSGGAANTDPNAALGGARSTEAGAIITSGVANNLFDDASGQETTDGDTEYRCIYVKNNHGTLTLQGAKVYIDTNTPSATTNCQIGLGTSVVDAIEQTIADEDTAPAGVSFDNAAGQVGGLLIGDLGPGQTKAIWVTRVINAGTVASNADGITFGVFGDTAA